MPQILKSKISEFERDICIILAQLSYHIHPKIISLIKRVNLEEYELFAKLFSGKTEIKNYLFPGSACVFPGVRRYVSRRGEKGKYNLEFQAIIDDSIFPRHLWCYLVDGKSYSASTWKRIELSQFELAHIFTHKKSEMTFEKQMFADVNENVFPYGDFTCACNVVMLPKGTVRPTDTSQTIKTVFFKRYIELYGEEPLNGRKHFKEEKVPDWYGSLKWNEPLLPDDWLEKTKSLLRFRTRRIRAIISK